MALQSLIWGLAQPLLGGLADRYGSGRVVALSALAYVAGLYLMSVSTDPWSMTFSTALLTGVAMSGTSFSMILAVIGRAAPPQRRGLYLGIGSAGGSLGQTLVVPFGQVLISVYGWVDALVLLAATAGLIVPLSAALAEKRLAPGAATGGPDSVAGPGGGPAPQGIPAAHRRVLRLRLPDPVHRPAPASATGGQRNVSRPGRHRDLVDRPVQRHRLPGRRRARQPLQQEEPAEPDLLRARGGDGGASSCFP